MSKLQTNKHATEEGRKCILITNTCTVKLVYKDHHTDEENVVLIHRWSLYAGSIAWKIYMEDIYTRGPANVVFISRWSLYAGGL